MTLKALVCGALGGAKLVTEEVSSEPRRATALVARLLRTG